MISRAMTPSDRRFVACTWARGARWTGSLDSRFRLVDKLIDGPARVRCLVTDERTVHAWLAHAGEVLLHVYCAPELRRHGLATRLIAEAFPAGPKTAAHPMPRWFLPGCHYRPHALAEVLAQETAA